MSSSDLPKLWTKMTKIGLIFRKQSRLKVFTKVDLLVKYSSQKKNLKDSVDFWYRKMTFKVQILQTLRRLFIILVGLTMTWFGEKILIFNIFRRLMPNLIKQSWTLSNVIILSVVCMYLSVKICSEEKKKTSQRPTPKYRNCMGLTIKFPFFPRKYVENEQNAHCDCVGIHIKDWKDRYAPMILVRL